MYKSGLIYFVCLKETVPDMHLDHGEVGLYLNNTVIYNMFIDRYNIFWSTYLVFPSEEQGYDISLAEKLEMRSYFKNKNINNLYLFYRPEF